MGLVADGDAACPAGLGIAPWWGACWAKSSLWGLTRASRVLARLGWWMPVRLVVGHGRMCNSWPCWGWLRPGLHGWWR